MDSIPLTRSSDFEFGPKFAKITTGRLSICPSAWKRWGRFHLPSYNYKSSITKIPIDHDYGRRRRWSSSVIETTGINN
jgi:hypothetical protein